MKEAKNLLLDPRRQKVRFCMRLSRAFEKSIEAHGGDPRAAIGQAANDGLHQTGGWVPDVSARDQRSSHTEFKKKP